MDLLLHIIKISFKHEGAQSRAGAVPHLAVIQLEGQT